ncbi:hypothetical protein GQ44DRAFT_715903 [Phaeosphaeriaceae sp. PMI808]|nr:hypothetical protein GQ44DRAFT_715903 [Phaeosphaeriaceae sp. PMI808]
MSQPSLMKHQDITPPQSIKEPPLTPPSTDKKPTAGACRVIALFRQIQAGRNTGDDPWIEFQLAQAWKCIDRRVSLS